MARPPGRPLAQISTLNPAGTLSLLTGISLAGVSVILPGCGASFDSLIAGGLPWCQMGGGLGLSWAFTAPVTATRPPRRIALHRMACTSFGERGYAASIAGVRYV